MEKPSTLTNAGHKKKRTWVAPEANIVVSDPDQILAAPPGLIDPMDMVTFEGS